MQVTTCLVHPCDWSLLPSTVSDVLICVFATRMFCHMHLSIPEKPRSAAHSSTSNASTGLLRLLVGALVHFVWQELQAACVAAATHQHPPHITIIGIPGWASTGAVQPKM